ncbi:hypothetical protein ACFSKM_09320 [Ancylobacter dichloromethanicus]
MVGASATEPPITHLDIARLIERAQRRFLDLLRVELARFGTDDISPVPGDGAVHHRQ